jgi:AraC-like DNA-binding protein
VIDSLTVLDMFIRGIAVGAMLVMGAGVWRSGVSRSAEIATLMLCVNIVCWLIDESQTLWAAFGHFYPIDVQAYPGGGLFWLFVLTVFEDRRISLANLTPTAILLVSGFLCRLLPHPETDVLWAARNTFSGLLCLHAAAIIARGWSGDLLEGRRRLRGLVIGFAALFAVMNVVLAFVGRADPNGPWLLFTVGRLYGGAIFAAVVVAAGAVFLQARPLVFSAARRTSANGADGRAEAAERQMLAKLNAVMAEGAWRREGLTIGALAAELGEPEHRLRRLINQRLGHRNFADFVNGYRIEAAKTRLADPAGARTTVAAIAFDLGYGSLGPFNRAFRAATGSTPTEWRREALQASPELQEAV